MSSISTGSRSDKVAVISAASPTSSCSRLSSTNLRSAEAALVYGESNSGNTRSEGGSAFSIKNFRLKKYVPDRLHPLQEESPRYPRRHPHQQRHLSVAMTAPSQYSTTPRRSPHVVRGATNPEDSDDEVIQLKLLHAHLTSGETIEEWIQSYERERGNFASFAVFTEVKLDEVQETYVEQAGRPNAVEAAACCATLLKMPGIVGCYKALLEKLSAGIQGAIYLPQASPPSTKTHYASPDSMTTLVQNFYSRTPYFDRVRELEKMVLTNRSISDPNVLKAMTTDDVAQIFQYVPFGHVQAGIAKVYATNSEMLEQLIITLHDQRGSLHLLNRKNDVERDDLEYPVHVPLATSAQICRAITQNAVTFSSSGRDMILSAIVDLIEVDSFRDVYQHFGIHGKMCFLHHLSHEEDMDQLELVVDILPNAGQSLFRLYLATCSGRVGDLPTDKGVGGEQVTSPSPKDVFFLKLLSPDMEFFFVSDLAAYLTKAQWQLLTKEFEKNENERKTKKKWRASIKNTDLDIEVDGDTNDDSPLSSQSETLGSTDGFQAIMVNYLRRYNLSSAQLLQLVANTFLSKLEEKEFRQLFDSCWARFPLDAKWSKVLAVVEDLGSSSQDMNQEDIVAIRLRMLKKIFKMLTQEERATWMDRVLAKYPTERYKKKIQDMKDAVTAALNTPPDLSDPSAHISQMKPDLKVLWLEAIMEHILNETENSARLAALKQALQPFANGGTGPPTIVQQANPSIISPEILLDQLSDADRAALLSKYVSAPPEKTLSHEKNVVDRASSPIHVELSLLQMVASPKIQYALKALLNQQPESQVLEILQNALDDSNADASSETVAAVFSGVNSDDEEVEQAQTPNLSSRLKGRLTAVNAVAEPMQWQEYVKVGCLDVGCQTLFEIESEQESGDTVGDLEMPQSSPSTRISSRTSVVSTKVTPLTLSSLLGKNATCTSTSGGKNKKERYQKINSIAVPRAVSGLITSWRMNTDQLTQFAKKSLANVLKIIADAYSEILTASRRKAQQQRLQYATPRRSGRALTLSQIVYQSFLHSYGLPGIADMHLLAFSCAIETYRTQHIRVEYFARFCFEEVPRSELTHYLEFLECVVSDDLAGTMTASSHTPAATPSSASSVGNSRGMQNTPPSASKRSRFVPRLIVPDKENWSISLDRAQEIAQLCFQDMRKSAVIVFCENLATVAAQGNSTAVLLPPVYAAPATDSTISGSGEQVLNVDYLLQLVIAEWKQEQIRREHHLLDAFRAGDVNGDGQLTSAEFTQIILSIDASRDLGDILLMYSDTLRRTECELINTDIFLQVAKEHELDRVVWQGDGDLFGVVNEITDMDATWAHVRGFFVGTLESLARDLQPAHFLRYCEGAGCGCLKCLLDGYVGFQKMRREFATQHQPKHPGNTRRNSYAGVSSQLVWARFWHLMRQLHDAAAESDGIVTPWEGVRYVRDQPVPPLAPRSNIRRRNSLPNFLFPDTARITAKMKQIHNPEVFDAPTIHSQFAYLLGHVFTKSSS